MGLCTECAAAGKTCCQRSDIIITKADIERIESAGYHDFHEYRRAMSDDYGQDEDPNWDSYTCREDGTRRMVRKRPEGDCLFLAEHGCVLDIDTRPLICRLYPYDYNERGLTGLRPYKCPPGRITADPSSLPIEFNLSPSNASKWHAQFYAELRADARRR
ncbi:MAG: YkgJ family cysteine cluster protein [Acidobacteria bacterium]|nr:YkgJ family cysteine cluster protein [Acidobacteriota bacterium]